MKLLLLSILLVSTAFSQDYDEEKVSSVERPVRFAGRYFIKNTLIEIFGKAAEPVIEKNYFKTGKQVGGPCDIYEQVFHEQNKVNDPDTECVTGKPGVNFPHFPRSGILRTSHIVKTCYELIYGQPLSKRLKKQFNNKVNSKVMIGTISKMFYPYGGDEALFDHLVKKYDKNERPSNEMRKQVLLSFCLSPGWQTL